MGVCVTSICPNCIHHSVLYGKDLFCLITSVTHIHSHSRRCSQIFTKWERTLGISNRSKNKVGYVAGSIVLLNFLVDIPVMILVSLDAKNIEDNQNTQYWILRLIRLMVETFSLLFSTIWLFAYSLHLNEKMNRIKEVVSTDNSASASSSVTSSTNRVSGRQLSLKRIVVVLFFCSISYLLRTFCLLLIIFDIILDSGRADNISALGWFMLSNWIPFLIPGLLFLYTSRMIKLDEVNRKSNFNNMYQSDFDFNLYGQEESVISPVSTDEMI